MSFLKGFIPSLILSFLAFSLIILYGGSFALSLIEEKENNILDDDDISGIISNGGTSVNTVQDTFSFALVITDDISDDEEGKEEEDGEENEDTNTDTDTDTDTDINTDTDTDTDTGTDTDADAGTDADTDTDTDTDADESETPGFVQDFEDILADDTVKLRSEIKFICVVHINKTASKSFITVIPGDSLAGIGGVEMPLSHALYFAQMEDFVEEDFISSTVVAHTGIVPDFYGSVDIDDFVELADVLGDLKYQNDYRITVELENAEIGEDTETSEDGDSTGKITVPIGMVDLTSETLKALLTYEEYPDRYRPSQVLIDVSKLMLDSICKQFKPNIISKVRSMLEYVETDFTASDMNKLSSVFFSYEDSAKYAVPLLGAYENIDDTFLFRVNSAASVKKFKEFLN